MALLESFLQQKISILTNDGRNLVGTLRGVDQCINGIVEDCQERVYTTQGVNKVDLGLYIVRGDNIAVIGEIDQEIDDQLDLSGLRGEPLKPIVH